VSGSREAVLGRIRRALGERSVAPAASYEAIPRSYIRSGTLEPEARIELFRSRIEHYDGGVHRCDRAAIAATIANVLTARGRRRLVVAAGVAAEWLPPRFDWIAEASTTSADLDGSDGAITGCSAAIARTGTILLRHAGADGRRALTLIPDYHLCVVFAAQVVETVPEGLARAWAGSETGLPLLLTTISGPSATADIEMTRIKGVHGPRTLDVVLVDGPRPRRQP
jgi:L-lactate dehydrogenase complex protein LldG